MPKVEQSQHGESKEKKEPKKLRKAFLTSERERETSRLIKLFIAGHKPG